MGKLYIGSAEPSKFYVGTEEVKKLCLGSDEIWSASNLPDWLPDGIAALLNAITPPSNYFVDIAFQMPASISTKFAYYRCYASADIGARLALDGNYYEVFQNPYQSSYRGWTTYHYYYDVVGTTYQWYLAGTLRNKNSAETEYGRGVAFPHKAIITPTFTNFINDTHQSDWEVYNL